MQMHSDSQKLRRSFLAMQLLAAGDLRCSRWLRHRECGADYVSSLFRRSAPEQGTGPVTVNRTIKLKFACTLPGAGQHRIIFKNRGEKFET